MNYCIINWNKFDIICNFNFLFPKQPNKKKKTFNENQRLSNDKKKQKRKQNHSNWNHYIENHKKKMATYFLAIVSTGETLDKRSCAKWTNFDESFSGHSCAFMVCIVNINSDDKKRIVFIFFWKCPFKKKKKKLGCVSYFSLFVFQKKCKIGESKSWQFLFWSLLMKRISFSSDLSFKFEQKINPLFLQYRSIFKKLSTMWS